MTLHPKFFALYGGLFLGMWGCNCNPSKPPPQLPRTDVKRCELDLSDFLNTSDLGASAQVIDSVALLIGGPTAQGQVGDVLLANQKIRVIIQGPRRSIGPNPYGGNILDVDWVRIGPGKDQFGELGLLYNFGRTVAVSSVQVLSNGSQGGPAIVAATGYDTAHDYLAIRPQLISAFGRAPTADPSVALPLLITHYYLLFPNETRIRYLTAFCNEGDAEVTLAVGDVVDPGDVMEFFNPQSCTNGFGFGGLCFGLDRSSWYGYQGDGIAFGYAPYRVNSPKLPEASNALLTVSGITGSIIGGNGVTGLTSWFDPEVSVRPGQLTIQAKESEFFARDFVVADNLGKVASDIEATRNALTATAVGQVEGLVTSDGKPVANARVAFKTDAALSAVFVTNDAGKFSGTLTAKEYSVSAWAPGHAPSEKQTVWVSPQGFSKVELNVGVSRRLSVQVRDTTGKPMPARVTVLCQGGACSDSQNALIEYTDVLKRPLLNSMRAVVFAGADGQVEVSLPEGAYGVVVSRGPEYSIYPYDWPQTQGVPVDLRNGNASVSAVLVKLLDTPEYVSADFHVHGVNSPDSIVTNVERVKGFAGDGVDVMVSTDHDYVTDYAPYIQEAKLTPYLASVIGEEVSTMSFGHYNIFPLKPDTQSLTQGAIDWAGGEGPTLRPAQIFQMARDLGAKTIHFNHPRGLLGGLTLLEADTDTLSTHAPPSRFDMQAAPTATEDDTQLLSADFNALEVMNNADDEFQVSDIYPKLNDWMTLLSRGLKVAATGTSDTHYNTTVAGWRTWVKTGQDNAAQFSPLELSTALNALKATVGNGLFVTASAHRVNAQGTQTSLSAGLGETVSASLTEAIELNVDIQAPSYLDVTRIEVYMHRPEDDAVCPIDVLSPRAATTRVACNGVMNLNWPAPATARDIQLGFSHRENITQYGGETFFRWRVKESFRIPAPTTDNWMVVLVYGSKSLFPLMFNPASSSSSSKTVLPFALTNPIFVDADGNGYDKPPFNPLAQGAKKMLPAKSNRHSHTHPHSHEEVYQRAKEYLFHH